MSGRMTEYHMEELACPKCGHKHMWKKYQRINVTEKQHLKDDILKNRLYAFTCEECSFTAPLTYESLYLDSKKKLNIYMSPVMSAEIDKELERLNHELSGHKRIVDNINDLKEKILISDMQFDDRVIEIIKVMYLGQLKEEMKEDTMLNILFDYYGNDPCFLVFFEKKGVGRMPLNLEYYRGISSQFEKKIRDFSRDDFMKVDMEWARQLMFDKNMVNKKSTDKN